MAKSKAVNLALFIHLMCIYFEYTIFLEAENCHSTWTRISSYIVLGSCVLFLMDIEIYPRRYQQRSSNLQIIVFVIEVILSLLCIEVFMLFFWLKLELVIVMTLKAFLGDIGSVFARNTVNFVVILISLISFIYAAFVTNKLNKIIANTRIYYEKLKIFVKNVFDYSSDRVKNSSAGGQGTTTTTARCIIVPCEQIGVRPQEICAMRAPVGPGGDHLLPTQPRQPRQRRATTPGRAPRSGSRSRSNSNSNRRNLRRSPRLNRC